MAVSVPNVTIKALMPITCTMMPFRSPAPIATDMAAPTAGQKPIESAVPTRTAAESAATDATERSKLPVMSTTVIATAMIDVRDD